MVKFADRVDEIKASDVREILKVVGKPGIISFAGGLPAPELFPVKEVKAAADAVLDEAGATALQYGLTEGWAPLRQQIAERLEKKNGIKTDAEHVLITAGSQQGLDFVAKLMLNPGDVVLLESPSYLGAITAFRPYQARFVEVPTDEQGMVMEDLDRILASTPNVKFIYTIPDFQNPSGRCWSLERRKQFMEIIGRYGVPAIEDNPYGDLRFRGKSLPTLKSMDQDELIIYLGTFSKILAPGLRIGWTVAGTEITEKLNLITQAAVLQSATINGMIVSKFLEMYDIEAHIARILPVYRHRAELMVKTMRECFPEEAKFTDPEGGLFTWVELPDYINTREVAVRALEKGVAVVPGDSFYSYGQTKNCMRLNFSNSTDEALIDGVHRLADTIKEFLK